MFIVPLFITLPFMLITIIMLPGGNAIFSALIAANFGYKKSFIMNLGLSLANFIIFLLIYKILNFDIKELALPVMFFKSLLYLKLYWCLLFGFVLFIK